MSLDNNENDVLLEEFLDQMIVLEEDNNLIDECGDEASSSSSSSSSSLLFKQPAVVTLEERVLSVVTSLHPHEEDIRTIQNANPAELDAILAQEMNRLSMAEQDRAALEVHGFVANASQDATTTTTTNGVVVDVENDDATFVQQRLQQLDDCLSRIRRTNDLTTPTLGIIKKEAYERALYQSPEYVQNDKFRLMFLRGERYDPVLAATRLIRHFHEKQLLFANTSTTTSTDLLARDVQWNDLDESDKEAIQSGFVQILPRRDCSNRAVVCLIPSLFPRAALPRVRIYNVS
jgi:hypothetical protein